MTRTDTAVARRPGLVIVVGFLAVLGGHFTLDRIGISAPLVNDVRIISFALFLGIFTLELTNAGGGFDRRGRVGKRCLYPVLAFFTYQAVSTLWAQDGARVNSAVGDLVSIVILVILYWALAEWDRDRVVRVTLGCFLAAGVLYFLFAASGRGHDPSGRWAALGGGANVFVRIMVLGGMAAVYFYCRSGGRIVWLLPIPAFIAGALFSGSRGGVGSALAVIALAIPALLPRLRVGQVISLTVTGLTLGAITWLVAGGTISPMVERRFVTTTFEKRYTSDRDVLYLEAYELFLDKPILGKGLDGFYALTNSTMGDEYVHNLPLAAAAEGGVVGVLLLGYAFWALRRGYALIPRAQRSMESRAAAYCGIFIGVASLFSGNYYDARLMWIFLILAAVAPPRRDTPAPAPMSPISRRVAWARPG